MEIYFFKDAVYYLRHICEDTVTIEVTKNSTYYEPMIAAEIGRKFLNLLTKIQLCKNTLILLLDNETGV
jgi:hypothetical protein